MESFLRLEVKVDNTFPAVRSSPVVPDDNCPVVTT